jgi:EAL domain-containing protein (putative c-di-GMP-specific phosphodiesterase class I)
MNEHLMQESGAIGMARAVALAHRYLGVDATYIAELTNAGQVNVAAAGDGAAFNVVPGDDPAADAPDRLTGIAAELPCVIRDAAADERVEDPDPATPLGAFIGVPLRLSDGRPFGALCGLSRTPRPALDDRDVRFMSMLGELIVEDLDEHRGQQQLRAALRGLIEAENVKVAYQPIIDLQTDHCLGIEALARFPEPFAKPDRTLAAAQRFGLSTELERLVVSQAWKILSLLGPGQFLSLNVAPDALLDLARRANLRDDLPLDQLVVEVTEHSEVDCYATLHRELRPLRERGLRIAVDDAGAGYASLRHILELRPDFIKVDRSLIDGVARDHARQVAVRAFLSLALDLGGRVVAEGVEQPEDLRVARELGAHAAQGYLLGRPTTRAEEYLRWIGPQSRRSVVSSRSRERRGAVSPRRRALRTPAG